MPGRIEIDLRLGAAFTRFQTLRLAKSFDEISDKVQPVFLLRKIPCLSRLCCSHSIAALFRPFLCMRREHIAIMQGVTTKTWSQILLPGFLRL
jgi:hypothetical protein